MFVTAISVTMVIFGTDPMLDAEPAVSVFRDVREILYEEQRASKTLAATNHKLERANTVQHEALFRLPIATVNGQVVTGADLLGRYSGVLKAIRESDRPETYQETVRTLIERELPQVVIETAIEQFRRGNLTEEQREELKVHLDRLFNSEVEQLKKEVGVESDLEFQMALKERGTTLQQVQSSFCRKQVAQEYFRILYKPIENESKEDASKRMRQQVDEIVSRTEVHTAFKWKPAVDNGNGTPAAPATE